MSRVPASVFTGRTMADEVVQHYMHADANFASEWIGRYILITGVGPDGIGTPTLAALARLPCNIVLAVRRAAVAEAVRTAVLSMSTCRAQIAVMHIDNERLDSVRALVTG